MSVPMDVAALYDTDAVEEHEAVNDTDVRWDADVRLVARARAGDHAAFDELVRRYRNDVFSLSYHYVRDREEAWDLAQDVFIKAHGGLRRFRGDSSFKTWLLRITINQCKDYYKKRKLKTVTLDAEEPAFEPPSDAPGPRRELESRELGEAIHEALRMLPEKHRTAFVLREFEGLSYENMAKAMGCTLGTVMSRLHHARKKLQKALTDMGVVEAP